MPHDESQNNPPPPRPDDSPVGGWVPRGSFFQPVDGGAMARDIGAEAVGAAPTPSSSPGGSTMRPVGRDSTDAGARVVANFWERDEVRVPRPIDAVTDDILAVCDGWPRRIGDRLFIEEGGGDDGTHGGTIRYLDKQDQLFGGFVARHVDQLKWVTGIDADGAQFWSKGEAMANLQHRAIAYEAASAHPFWPVIPSVWTPFNDMLAGNPDAVLPNVDDAWKLVNELVDWFLPSDPDVDPTLIAALFLTQFWGGPPGERPLIIVHGEDGERGQGGGKSTLVNLLAIPTGGAFALSVLPSADPPLKQLVSDPAQNCRVVLIDNMPDKLRDTSELESAITAPNLQGRAAWGAQVSLPNLRTWTATTNYLRFRADLAKRSVILRLRKPPENSHHWKVACRSWIKCRSRELSLAAVAILRGGPLSELPPELQSRFPEWGNDVLACCPGAENVLARYHEDVSESDVDADDARMLTFHMRTIYTEFRGATTDYVTPKRMAEIYNESGAETRRRSAAQVERKLETMVADGRLPFMEREDGGAGRWIVDVSALTGSAPAAPRWPDGGDDGDGYETI